jgi:hypothetical protein
MDAIILALALIAFLGLIVSWLMLPSGTPAPMPAHVATAVA